MYTESAGVPKIYNVGLALFLQHIIRSKIHPIHTHLIATLLSQVQLERDGETITRSTIRECVDILLRLTLPEREGGKNVYLSDFEPEFLRRSAEFYQVEATEVLESGDASRYLKNVSRNRKGRAQVRWKGDSSKKRIAPRTTCPPSPISSFRTCSSTASSRLICPRFSTCPAPALSR